MAGSTTKDQTPPETPQDQAQEQAVEPTTKLDVAPFPGGIYIVNGVKVNANNEPIDDEGTVLKGNK